LSFDQEQLRQRRVLFLAVGQLARQRRNAHHRLAAGFSRLARSFAGGRGVDYLLDDRAGMLRVFLKPLGELVGHQAFERLTHFGTDELVLGLAAELGVRQLDRDDGGQAFAHILAGQPDLLFLQDAGLFRIIVEGAGQRGAKSGQVRAAVALRDVVGERQDVLVIAVVPFQRDVDRDVVAAAVNRDRVRDERCLGAVEPLHERRDAAFIIEVMFLALVMAFVSQDNADARIEKRQLAVAMLEPVEVEFGNLERGRAGQEGNLGALLPFGLADNLERRNSVSVCEAHVMLFVIAPDGQIKEFAERVHDRDANAVEAA
jgi:hypothetical protein